MAEANRATQEGETARVGEGGLVVRVQLRDIQPTPHTEVAGAVCMSATRGLAAASKRRITGPFGSEFARFQLEIELQGARRGLCRTIFQQAPSTTVL